MTDGILKGSDTQFPDAEAIDWIVANLELVETDTTAFIYDLMESQSGRSLSVIYQPFDPANLQHVADRGWMFDFVKTLELGSREEPRGRVLDFGPGDGWPSLLIAPFCSEVTGVDASARRVEICTANAARLGITNAHFVHVPVGESLPFADGTFDAVAAASSIENTPDPRATLAQLHRVLRPGGRLRMYYEALGCYRGGREREAWVAGDDQTQAFIVVYDRDIDAQSVRQYRLGFDIAPAGLSAVFNRHGVEPDYAGLTTEVLAELKPMVASAAVCTTAHPCGRTWREWLLAAGFDPVSGTNAGGPTARRMLWLMDPEQYPANLEAVDSVLEPFVGVCVTMPAPIEDDPVMTAVKPL